LKEQREALMNHESMLGQLREKLLDELELYRVAAARLTSIRETGAKRLEEAVARELADVALANARWGALEDCPSATLAERLERVLGERVDPPRKSGTEQVEFYFSANPGEDLRPLTAVASGGELSRLMLVLKTVIAPALFPRTLIFDEIDAGIGERSLMPLASDCDGSQLQIRFSVSLTSH
jgi:DNA repair protein RecN (Recombination protein N)